jgi:hypothetical protein
MVEQAMAMRRRDDEVFPNAAGIDIDASSHWVAVPRHLAEQAGCEPVREVGAMTDDLNALADWLLDARQMKYVPGRKSDVQECQWRQKLMSLGRLRGAWRPDGQVCVVRAVARQRGVLITDQATWVQRMQKAPVQMNIQLTEVLGDVLGATGQAIIRAIVAGERDPKVLARHRSRRVKASAEEVTKALTGNWRDEHLFVLGQALAMSSGTKRSANRARQALKMAAMSLSRSDSALGALYRRLSGRMEKPRANTATAHKPARTVYFMLTRGEQFVDQGQQRHEDQQRQRSIAALKRRAAALRFQLNPTTVAA